MINLWWFNICILTILGVASVVCAGDIHDAAANGDADRVGELLKAEHRLIGVHEPTLSDSTPLHLAAMNGHIRVVEMLLAAGSAVDAKDCGGWTPLMRAVANQRTNVVECLLAGNASVNSTMAIGRTPLHYAVMGDDLQIASMLLAYNADVNAGSGGEYDPPPLHVARSAEMLEILLAGKADIEATDQSGKTVLHKAAGFDITEFAKILISHKADVNARDRTGRTPLHSAVWRHSTSAVKLLLDNGANAALCDEEGKIPLQIARERGYKDIVALLE